MENDDNNNYLFELIQSIQSKLNEDKPQDSKEEKVNMDYIQETMFKSEQKKDSKKENSNFNISDLLNNLNLGEQKKKTKQDNNNFNISDLLSNLNLGEQKKETKQDNNNFNISDLLSNFNLYSLFGNGDSGFDINSIMKIQKVLSALGKDDPRKNLLISLKPFLRKSRQDKISEYLTYLSIGSALGIFDDKGSGNDVI